MESRDTDLRVLVGRLNNLHEIFRVQGEILTYGEEAVEPLAALLVSEPSGFSEPRVAAAECLGAIGTETKAFYYFYIPRRMAHCGTREAFLARGFRYGFSLEPDRPEGTEPLAAYRGEDPDDPPQVLWRRTP